MEVGAAIANEFMGVGGNKCDAFGSHVAVDARHLLTHLVGGSGESCLVDGVDKD